MKAISTGNIFKIYDDSLRTYDKLPAQSYTVRFDKMSGFFLEKHADIEIKEDKIYGIHNTKVDKVFTSFTTFNRNLGVILSGDKGIGKSLFAKLLAIKANSIGYPLIIVDSYIPGIAAYIESIEQEVVVLFDEFDKTFSAKDDGVDVQATMLSLFDGTAQGKKLFVVTCNELRKLNDYLVNRPGRFHYHFRFDYPTPEEIKEYLTDKLNPEYYTEIDKVIAFSRKVKLNYDCLRAITFEINFGSKFEDAIVDLNIVNVNDEAYNVAIYFEDGSVFKCTDVYIDMFNSYDKRIDFYLHGEYYDWLFTAIIDPTECIFDTRRGVNIFEPANIKLEFTTDGDMKETVEKYSKLKVDHMTVIRKREKSLHYTV